MYFKSGEIYSNHFTAGSQLNVSVKEFGKSANI